MDERPYAPDPNALTQPIPVVQVAPPPRPATARVASATYVHRFGSIPWYLFGRLAAFLIDYVAVSFVVATFGFHVIERGFILFAGRDAAGFATLATASFGFASLFAFVCEAALGTTLGKLVFALQVRRRDGGHAGAGRVLVRSLFLPIDALLIGPLLALVTPRHQRLGDVLAGTVVGGNRIGAFASLIGLLLAAAIGYAQITFGGGITSALGVVAETADFTPAVYASVAGKLGIASARPAAVAPNVEPSVEPSVAPTRASSGTSSV